jgi:NADH-quinone oxidoreductase subunit M
MDFPVLSALTYLPLVGAAVMLCIPREQKEALKSTAVATCALTLGLAALAWASMGPTAGGAMSFTEKALWIPQVNIYYHMGVDGISMPLVFLTPLVTLLALMYSWNIEDRTKEYFILFLILQTAITGVFVSLDFFLFYIFWEVSLVPMYFIIGIWGHKPRCEYAAIKFFLYTLAGSVLMLLAILACWWYSGNTIAERTFDMLEMFQRDPASHMMAAGATSLPMLCFWGMFIGFAIKVPSFPFHTWLPDAHVEAPTAGSVVLAGLLLKLGGYAMIRILIPLLPGQFREAAVSVAILAVISIVYGSLVAMAQPNLKKLIAYSSIAHMGFVTLGFASATPEGISGAVVQMFSHGLLTSGLFLLAGTVYQRAHTYEIDRFGGIAQIAPVFAGIFIFICMGSLGLPSMSGFVSELFVLLGAYYSGMGGENVVGVLGTPWFAYLSGLGIVLGAAYLLWTIQRVLMGELKEEWRAWPDLTKLEVACLVPLMVGALIIGLYPKPLLAGMQESVSAICDIIATVVR